MQPEIRQQALALVRWLPQKDYIGEATAIQNFVRDVVRYVRDPVGVETLHTAPQMIRQWQGDCDDKSILVASLLEAIGHPVQLVAVGWGGHYRHVFVEVNIYGDWYTVETTEPWEFGESIKQTPPMRMVEPVI